MEENYEGDQCSQRSLELVKKKLKMDGSLPENKFLGKYTF